MRRRETVYLVTTNVLPTQERAPRRVLTAAATRPSFFAVRLGLAGIGAAVLFMVHVTLVASGRMSILDTTMSDYVFVQEVGWMFNASLMCVSVAGIGTMLGLSAVRLLDGKLLRLSLVLAVIAGVLAAVFQTDLGESVSTSAQIHRYAAGVVFFCVPIATLLVARQLRGVGYLATYRKWMTVNAIASSVVLTLFLTSHLGPMPEAIGELNGLFQRILFVLELGLLAQLVLLPVRFRTPVAIPAQRRTVMAESTR